MHSFERDFFISRIRCGYIRFKYNNENYIYKPPSNELAYESNIIYKECYEQSLEDGVLDDEEIYDLLIRFNLWNEEESDRLQIKIPEYIDNIKVEMCKSFHNQNEVKRMRLYLNKAKEELVRLFEIRHQFDYMSCHGSALFARWQFIVQNCVISTTGKEVNWDKISVPSILSIISNDTIDESKFRILARTEPWATTWSINKKNNNLFGLPSCDFTEEQRKLVCWSLLFDSLNEIEDAPSDELIADDDCFDGWLINKRREQKAESDRDLVEKRLGKNANADEVYIPVKTLNSDENEDLLNASTVLSMNNEFTKNIIKSRVNAVQSGGLQERDLPDVRLKISMAANRK